jgi:Prokaryotic E2 family E
MRNISVLIDRKSVEIAPGLTLGQDLINKAALTGAQQLLLERKGDIDILVAPQDGILLRGGEEFVISDGSPPAEDNPCVRHPVRFDFNGQNVPKEQLFQRAKATGAEIKQLDPNLKASDQLIADLDHLADEVIADGLRMILQKQDKYITAPCGNVGDGLVLNQLSELQASFPGARIELEAGNQLLVVPNCPLPLYWSHEEATLLVVLPNGFPISAPDMFWVTPHLKLKDGREPAGATERTGYLGQTWQRFSWHLTEGNGAWRVGHSTMLSYVHFCLSRFAQNN